MDLIFKLVQLIKFSPKRLSLFDRMRNDVAINSGDLPTPRLRTLCPTRWTVRHASINSVLLNYKVLQETLDEVQKGTDDYAAKARGMLSRMETFEIYFGLQLAYLIFATSEQLSINMQAVKITVQEAVHGADLLVSRLKALRRESEFNSFYEKCVRESHNVTDEPQLPRYRKKPKRLDGGESPHRFLTPKDRYRHAFFESLELAAGEVEKRFDQPDLHLIKKIEGLLLNAGNGQSTDIEADVQEYLKQDVDCSRLQMQLSMIPDMIKTAFSNHPVSKVTNVRTIADAMNQNGIYKSMLSELDKCLILFL